MVVNIILSGTYSGYFSNTSKAVLIVKSNLLIAAKSIFEDTDIYTDYQSRPASS